MSELIYCKNFTNSPRDCSGIAYQVTYDSNGKPNGAYRCNFCYKEKAMSEHSVLLATQKKVDQLELENSELRTRNGDLEKQVTELLITNTKLSSAIDSIVNRLEYES